MMNPQGGGSIPVHNHGQHQMEQTDDNIEQTLCPIMGGQIDKKYFTVYKGKKVYFCCPGCEEKFNENPELYLDKLPQFKNQ